MRYLSVLLFALCTACSSDVSSLRVIVKVAGSENIDFESMQVNYSHGGENQLLQTDAPSERDLRRGVEIARFEGAALAGDFVQIATFRGNQTLSRHEFSLSAGQQEVTIEISGGCTIDACKPQLCQSSRQCKASVACATTSCVDGICQGTLDDNACLNGGTCRADLGCIYEDPICGDGIVSAENSEICDIAPGTEKCTPSNKQCLGCLRCKQKHVVLRNSSNPTASACTEIKENGAGDVILRTTRTIDAFGNLLRLEIVPSDGTTEDHKYTYNEDYKETSHTRDLDGDGTIEEEESTTYYPNGLVRRVEWRLLSDSGYREYEYDGSERQIRVHQESDNRSYDYRFEHDDQGRIVRLVKDDGRDGIVTYQYRDDNLLREEERNEAGEVTRARIYMYDAQGRLTREETKVDQKILSVISKIYEGARVFSTAEADVDLDGAFDFREIRTHENGLLIRIEDDQGNDGMIDNTTTRTYDRHGNLIDDRIDHNNDGSIDYRTTIERNDWGDEIRKREFVRGEQKNEVKTMLDSYFNKLEVSKDADGDGRFESLTTYMHDELARPTKIIEHLNGEVTVSTSYSYDCFDALLDKL